MINLQRKTPSESTTPRLAHTPLTRVIANKGNQISVIKFQKLNAFTLSPTGEDSTL